MAEGRCLDKGVYVMIDRKLLTRIALEQLLAQLDCGIAGVPAEGWREQWEIRMLLGENSTAKQDEAIAELHAMLDAEEIDS